MAGFLRELGRRNVLRAGVLYITSVWALAQGITALGPTLGAPDWTTRWFLAAAAIGFPLPHRHDPRFAKFCAETKPPVPG